MIGTSCSYDIGIRLLCAPLATRSVQGLSPTNPSSYLLCLWVVYYYRLTTNSIHDLLIGFFVGSSIMARPPPCLGLQGKSSTIAHSSCPCNHVGWTLIMVGLTEGNALSNLDLSHHVAHLKVTGLTYIAIASHPPQCLHILQFSTALSTVENS